MGYRSWKAYFDSFPLKTRLLFLGMVLYLGLFTLISYLAGNEEFLFYAAVMFCFFVFIVSSYHRLRLTTPIMVGIAFHWFLHFLGGTVYVHGVRLYDTTLLPLNQYIIHYDNMVHTVGVFVLTFIAYNLLRPHFRLRDRTALVQFSLLLVLVVMGIGAFAEIGELVAVLFFHAGKTVGDYFNNAFDLVFNATGSILACIVIAQIERRKIVARKK